MTTFTVMTFNIKGSYYEDGANNWEHRASVNVTTVQTCAPDLIGFQELQEGNRATYAEHLPAYDYELGPLVARENDSGQGYHCAIYWRADRFEKLDQGYYFLNETPWVYALHWDVVQGRGLNWVKLRDKVTGTVFVHMNTHLPHISEEGRRKGAALIVERTPAICAGDLPAILTGDFNSRAVPLREEWVAQLPPEQQALVRDASRWYLWDNVVYRTFINAGFKDSAAGFLAPDNANTDTFHGLRGLPPVQSASRIDWILLRDTAKRFQVYDTRIVHDAAPPLYPSDHYPVVSLVELE